MPNTCETCGWWSRYAGSAKGECGGITPTSYDRSAPSEDAESRQALIAPPGQTKRIGLHVVDAPRLITAPGFSCGIWKP